MSAEGAKLSYDNKLLRAAVVQLQTQVVTVPALLSELAQLRKSSLAAEAKYTKVPTHAELLYKKSK